MQIGEQIYQQFLDGNFNTKSFIVQQLESNGTRLSKFLSKEFARKKIKIKYDNLQNNHISTLCYGKHTEWWIADNKYFDDYQSLFNKRIKYVLPFLNGMFDIIALERKKNEIS